MDNSIVTEMPMASSLEVAKAMTLQYNFPDLLLLKPKVIKNEAK
jgi:hypothetical protein